MNADRVLIAGSGALATLFAARLAAAGIDVVLLGGWQEGMQALRANGAVLDGRAYPVRVVSRPEECPGMEACLVLVKSWQTGQTARLLQGCLAPGGVALTLQNGLGNEEILAGVLGAQRVRRGMTTLGATSLAPGQVASRGEGPIALPGDQCLGRLHRMLSRAGFQVETPPDLPARLWGKLAVNAAINPLSALLQVENGVLLRMPAVCRLMDALAAETALVARSQGVDLVEETAVQMARQVTLQTAANHSSMLQDVLRGAPTEMDAINGAVARLGKEKGLPVLFNQTILRLMFRTYPLSWRAWCKAEWRGEPELGGSFH